MGGRWVGGEGVRGGGNTWEGSGRSEASASLFASLRLGRLLRRGPERDCGRGEGGIRGLGATFGRGVSEQHAPPFP